MKNKERRCVMSIRPDDNLTTDQTRFLKWANTENKNVEQSRVKGFWGAFKIKVSAFFAGNSSNTDALAKLVFEKITDRACVQDLAQAGAILSHFGDETIRKVVALLPPDTEEKDKQNIIIYAIHYATAQKTKEIIAKAFVPSENNVEKEEKGTAVKMAQPGGEVVAGTAINDKLTKGLNKSLDLVVLSYNDLTENYRNMTISDFKKHVASLVGNESDKIQIVIRGPNPNNPKELIEISFKDTDKISNLGTVGGLLVSIK